jgi:hypothetical protein
MNGKSFIDRAWTRRILGMFLTLVATGPACARPPAAPESAVPAAPSSPVEDRCARPPAERPADCPPLPPDTRGSVLGEVAVLDGDGDGIDDVADQCPGEPEDLDGYQDQDGCPDNLEEGNVHRTVAPLLQERHPAHDGPVFDAP